jgi:pilus assembly protein CpaD
MTLARSQIVQPFLGLAAVLVLSACASTPRPDTAPNARLATEQFPIAVEDQPQEMLLAAHAEGLSPNQRAALYELALDWRDRGRGPIRILVPVGEAGRRVGEAARLALIANGAPEAKILLGPAAAGGADGPVRVAFVTRAARLPDCAAQWDNLTSTGDNAPHSNFGCAIAANMAAQMADPSDLVGARPMDPADAGRRQVVLDKYRKGEVTGAAKPVADGYISDAIK